MLVGTNGFAYSLVVVVAFGWLLLPGAMLFALRRAWQGWSLARSIRSGDAKPFTGRPGPAVARGTVAWIDPTRCPVEVEIEQHGTETADRHGGVAHWVEVRRSVRLEPFDLILVDGRKVRVEPDADAKLADELDDVTNVSTGVRIKRARFDQGEAVWVAGAVRPSLNRAVNTDAYRGVLASAPGQGQRSLVLRSSPFEPMLLSSSQLGLGGLLGRFFHSFAAILFMLAALGLNAGIFGDFYTSLLHGRVVQARVVGERSRDDVRVLKGGRREHFTVDSLAFEYTDSVGERTTLQLDMNADQYNYVMRSPSAVALRVVEGGGSRQQFLGTHPVIIGASPFFAFGSVMMVLLYWAGSRALRPWYARTQLDERENGALPVVVPQRPAD